MQKYIASNSGIERELGTPLDKNEEELIEDAAFKALTGYFFGSPNGQSEFYYFNFLKDSNAPQPISTSPIDNGWVGVRRSYQVPTQRAVERFLKDHEYDPSITCLIETRKTHIRLQDNEKLLRVLWHKTHVEEQDWEIWTIRNEDKILVLRAKKDSEGILHVTDIMIPASN